MKKLLTILSFLFVAANCFSQVPKQDAYANTFNFYPSSNSGTLVLIHGKDKPDTLVIKDKDTAGWHPADAGTVTYHSGKLFIWNGSRWNFQQSAIDSIFITRTDSIFVITGSDTLYIGNSLAGMDSAYTRNDSIIGYKNGSEFFVGLADKGDAYLYFGAGTTGGYFHSGGIDDTIKVDTIEQVATKYDLTLFNSGTTFDSTNGFPTLVLNIADTPLASATDSSIYLITKSPPQFLADGTTTNPFYTHHNDAAQLIDDTWTFFVPTNSQTVANVADESFYQYNSISDLWSLVRRPFLIGGGSYGINQKLFVKDNKDLLFGTHNIERGRFTSTGNLKVSSWQHAGDPIDSDWTVMALPDGTSYVKKGTALTVDGTTITGDGTPTNPLVSHATGGGGSVETVTGNVVDNTDPANPIVTAIADTSAINAEIVQLRNAQLLKLNISDTASMLSPYLRSNVAAATYRTQSQVRTDVSLTTTGTSGAATYNNSTGVFNIPQYSGGGGSGLDTSHFITPNVYAGLGYSDNRKIQLAYNLAQSLGKVLFIGWNNDRNSHLWLFDSAVRIGSNSTIICNAGDTLQKSNTCRDNLFRTTNIDYGVTNWLSNQLNYIELFGNGAVIKGADNPRSSGDAFQTISTAPTLANSKTYGTDEGVSGQSQHGDWRNNGFQLSNVKGFKIVGFKVVNMEAYGITCGHCRDGIVDNVIPQMQGYANGDTARILHNEGTLDFHQGANNIFVMNSPYGFSQDDFLAFNLTNNTDSTAGHLGYYPEGDSASATVDSITNITVAHIHVGSNANTIRTFIPPGSFVAYNYSFSDIVNTLNPADPFFHNLNGSQASTIQIGATATGQYGGNTSWGQWKNLIGDNIRNNYTTYTIRVQNKIQDSRFLNLYKRPNGDAFIQTPLYKDGSFADFKNVISTRIDSGLYTIVSISGYDLLQMDSTLNLYTNDVNKNRFKLASWNASTSFGLAALGSAPLGGVAATTAIGDHAGFKITSGTSNTFIGANAGYNTVAGTSSVYIGADAGDSANANNNFGAGAGALNKNTQNNQTAAGYHSMFSNTSGDKNAAFGYNTSSANSTGNENTAMGSGALSSNTTSFNTGIGFNSLNATVNGSQNTGLGARSGQINTGTGNTFIGFESGANNTSGGSNTFLGDDAGFNLNTGSGNIGIGYGNYGVAGWSNTFFVDNANNGTNDFLYGIMTSTTNRYLKVNAGFALAYAAKATSYTITNADHTINITATGQTITLPSAATVTGMTYTIKLTASGSATVATTSSQTIDGSTTYSLSAQYKYVTVQSDGANWMIIGQN